MQEIKKRRIVIASVLKPVNDPRMFEKMGQSLSADYEVHILGTMGVVNTAIESIFFHPLSAYTRVSVHRILAPLKILRKILQLKPALLIICTHELLWMVLVVKIFLPCKVIYDIRENYYRNILYTNAFPRFLRILIAVYVRIKEWIVAPFINRFFLAEAGYAREISFVGNKKVILENKVKKFILTLKKKWSDEDHNIHMLFSGTLAPSTGVFIAIDLAIKLHANDRRIRLHIVGFSPLRAARQEIKDLIRDKGFIQFRESDAPIPHAEILNAIAMADIGIISYPPNLSTENSIPTKLFEYLGHSLPILLINHSPWIELCRPYAAAVTFDLNRFNAEEILRDITQTAFYTNTPNTVFWESEEGKLLHTVSQLLK